MTRTWQFVVTRVRLIADTPTETASTLTVLPGQAGSNSDDEDGATMSDISEDNNVLPPAKRREITGRASGRVPKKPKGPVGKAVVKGPSKGKEKAKDTADIDGSMLVDDE
jgi:hypothetical protein